MFVLVLALATIGADSGWIASAAAGRENVSASPKARAATAILKRLDLNSFPNSSGPRRRRSLHIPSDYGFTDVKSFDDGWAQLSEPEDSWHISALLLASGKGTATVCFVDAGGKGSTYRATQVLDATLGVTGLWTATQVADRPDCRNNPPYVLGVKPD